MQKDIVFDTKDLGFSSSSLKPTSLFPLLNLSQIFICKIFASNRRQTSCSQSSPRPAMGRWTSPWMGYASPPTLTFSMSDVYENRISYNHDGTNTLSDQFEFTVSDGTNPMYVVERGMEMLTTSAPQVSLYFLKISIYAVINCDNGGNF